MKPAELWRSIQRWSGALIAPPPPELQSILQAETERNLAQIAVVRFVGGSVWLLMAIVAGIALEQPDWLRPLPTVALYAALAVVLLFGAQRWPVVKRARLWALPAVDFPLIFLSMDASLADAPHPTAGAMIVALAFVLFIVPAPAGARAFFTGIAALEGFVLSAILLHHAGVKFPAWTPTLAAVFAVAWLAGALVGRRALIIAREYSDERSKRERMGRYFSPEVAQQILEQPEAAAQGQLQQVTALFADLRGFTAMSEKMSPEDVVSLLNGYLERMVAVIFAHGGTLDKFLGDGILAYFGAPLIREDHALRAARCAMDMHQALEQLNKERAASGLAALQIGIGLNSGAALVGDIGPATRREFTVVGDTINLASRIEALTKELGRSPLAARSVVDAAGESSGLSWQSAGEISVRGKETPVELLQLHWDASK
ncbi:MAG: adenylate/guanylate cyclase domain-containing protein [Leptospirales bacterium]|nr:adenylate/guanylate cyclase domain-containing protein [Leptospirales bacterium]